MVSAPSSSSQNPALHSPQCRQNSCCSQWTFSMGRMRMVPAGSCPGTLWKCCPCRGGGEAGLSRRTPPCAGCCVFWAMTCSTACLECLQQDLGLVVDSEDSAGGVVQELPGSVAPVLWLNCAGGRVIPANRGQTWLTTASDSLIKPWVLPGYHFLFSPTSSVPGTVSTAEWTNL